MTENERPSKIRFDYLKSQFFRMIHADGVVGGPTPKGLLFISFFNERAPIPQQVVHQIEYGDQNAVAQLGKELSDERVSRNAVVRETEVGVLLDLQTAEKLQEWLTAQIEGLRKARTVQQK